ncbi:MAG: diphosphate--fructose-6-phosphate 1-phosphotransferase [Deltaproteobacteria bacterium]|nr:diphosphate--fructose-6-phosphate 1-phosphotransferase [Deltaproteobacteria bacterium]
MPKSEKLAILVGGGPAPGINSVISAATIRALLQGVEVLGIRDGFSEIMQGKVDRVRPLSIEEVSRIHFSGGSYLGTSRANPTKKDENLANVVASLEKLGVSQLITIGGDDTAFSAMKVAEKANGSVRVVHVPKTIDNDLDLPADIDTFGYQTARHVGVEVVKNLMVDAKTTSRWYFVVAMGRKAGHLALGIGKAAGATLTVIPEEFPNGKTSLDHVVDILAGAVIKRLAQGRRDGVAVLAEGLAESIPESELSRLGTLVRDEHDHIRFSELDLGRGVKQLVEERLKRLGIKITIVSKDIGYELRCADPIPADIEYTRDLGYCAAKYLFEGGNAAMVSLQGGHFVPIPFARMLDPVTGKTRVRMVDIHSTRYGISRRYQIRLRRDDFDHFIELEKYAKISNMTVEDFKERFHYVVANEPPPVVLNPPAIDN